MEGDAVRLARPGERHHRRQAAVGAVADGPVRPRLRHVVVERPAPAGDRGRRLGGPALRVRSSQHREGGTGAAGGRGLRSHTGLGAGVPLQQSRRDAHRSAPRRGLCDAARTGQRASVAVGAAGRSPVRARFPDQDARSVHRSPRPCAHLRGLRTADAPGPAEGRRRRDGRTAGRSWLVGRARGALAGGQPSVHRRIADQLGPATHLRLQRLRPDHREHEQHLGTRRPRRHERCSHRPDRLGRRDPVAPSGGPGRLRAGVGGEQAARRALANPGGPGDVVELAPARRGDVRSHGRDLPLLLHRDPGSGDLPHYSLPGPGWRGSGVQTRGCAGS